MRRGHCQLCNKVMATYQEWLLGDCPRGPDFGHKLTDAEVTILKLQRPPEREEEEVAP